MNEPQFGKARDAVRKILDILKITRVVCVDDIYSNEPPVEEVIVAAGKIEAETLKKLLPELGDSVPNDPDVLSSQIRRLWGELNPEIARRRARILLSTAFPDKSENKDLKDASALAEVIPSVTELSPQQWSKRTRQFLAENSEQRTLFLFDQDLSRSGGDEGIRIISSLLAGQETKDRLICGLWPTLLLLKSSLQNG
jgi:hypothetical protein